MTLILLVLFGTYATLTDVKEMRIPDTLIATALIAALLLSVGSPTPPLPVERLGGILLAWGQMHLARFITRYRLGLGDVKYSAAMGGIIGLRAWLIASIASSVLALIVLLSYSIKEKQLQHGPIPFAPYLSFGSVIGWFVTMGF